MHGNSAALIADAGHSLSDLVTDALTLVVLRVSNRPADSLYAYGYGKVALFHYLCSALSPHVIQSEPLGALFVSMILAGTGVSLGMHAYDTLLLASAGGELGTTSLLVPTNLALAVGLLSIAGKVLSLLLAISLLYDHVFFLKRSGYIIRQ